MSTTKHETLPKSHDKVQAQRDANRDPLSGRAGAHPVGTGVGAAVGGAAVGGAAVAAVTGTATGAAIGTAAGPVGTAVGAVVGAAAGAVAGGLAGKAIAEHVNPTEEHGYWRKHYAGRPYVKTGMAYEEYAPAYQYGWEAQARHPGKSFDQAESTLERDWHKAKGTSKLEWVHAKEAVRDSWNRISKG